MSICTWNERWLVVHRAQAHDNPIVSRSDNVVYVYSALNSPRHYIQCRNADIVVKRQENGGALVRFNLISRTQTRDAQDSRVVPEIECKAPIHVYEWLRDVLGDDFGRGQGPRIDPTTGRAAIPPWAQRLSNGQRVQRPPSPQQILAERRRQGGPGSLPGASPAGAEVVPLPVPPRSSSLSAAAASRPSTYVAQQEQLSPQVQAFDDMLATEGHAAAVARFGPAVAQQHAEAQRQAYEAASAAARTQRAHTHSGGMAAGSGLMPAASGSAAAVAPAPAPQTGASGPMYPSMAAMITQPPATQVPPVPVPVPEAVPADGVQMDDRGVPVDAPDPPGHLCCVLTMDLFEDPVFLSDGHTYERSAIEQWLKDHNTSPKTNLPLPDARLIPNHALRGQVIEWIEGEQRTAKAAAKARADAQRAAAEQAAAEQAAAEQAAAEQAAAEQAAAEQAAAEAALDPTMSYLRLAEQVATPVPAAAPKDVFTFPQAVEAGEAEATAPPPPPAERLESEEMGLTPAAASGSSAGVAQESGVSEATAAQSSGFELGGTYVHFDDDEEDADPNQDSAEEMAAATATSDFNPFLHMPDAPSHQVGATQHRASQGSVNQLLV